MNATGTNTITHTPLPWKSHVGGVWQDAAPGTHTLVATCNNPADTELIEVAANCHAALVRALRNLVARYEHIEAERDEPCEYMAAARAALADVDDAHLRRVERAARAQDRSGYVMMLDTIAQGRILAERDGYGQPVVYDTLAAAQRELADDLAEQYRQVADGERAFDEVNDEVWIEPVALRANGDIVDAAGKVFGNTNQPLPY